MAERDIVLIIGMLVLLAVCVLMISALMGLPMPWWSRQKRHQWWAEYAADLEHDRHRFGWSDRPSERRKRIEEIERAHAKAERLASPLPDSGAST